MLKVNPYKNIHNSNQNKNCSPIKQNNNINFGNSEIQIPYLTPSGKEETVYCNFSEKYGYPNYECLSLFSKEGKKLAEGQLLIDYQKEYIKPFFGTPLVMEKKGGGIYTNFMKSFSKGAGTVFHQATAQRSFELGYNGQIFLESAWASTPFHYSCGFKPISYSGELADAEWIEQLLKEYKETGKRITKDLGSHKMFLDNDGALKLISTIKKASF